MSVVDLESGCPVCARPIGVHLVAEWLGPCAPQGHHLPYEEVPGPPIMLDLGGRELHVVDQVAARAAAVMDADGRVTLRLATLLLSFGQGQSDGSVREVAEVAVVASPAAMRKIGVVLRDTANGAANAAAR